MKAKYKALFEDPDFRGELCGCETREEVKDLFGTYGVVLPEDETDEWVDVISQKRRAGTLSPDAFGDL